MSVAVREYTDASQMLADYVERRRRMFAPKPKLVVAPLPPEPKPVPEPEQASEPEPEPETDIEAVEAPAEPAPRLSARQILRETCQRHGVKVESVLGSRRHLPLVICRREAAWLIAKETSLSMPQIGMILNKDHTTVLMAIRRQNEIAGENVRGCGGIPEKTRERNRLAASQRKGIALTRRQRIRKSEMARNREDFRL